MAQSIRTMAKSVYHQFGCGPDAIAFLADLIRANGLVDEAVARLAEQDLEFWKRRARLPSSEAAAQQERDYSAMIRRAPRCDAWHWPLASGKFLCDATYEELVAQRARHAAAIRGETRSHDFMDGVISAMAPGQVVSSVLAPDDVQRIYDDIYVQNEDAGGANGAAAAMRFSDASEIEFS